jgi:DNA-binding PadR family transcriptional regulator
MKQRDWGFGPEFWGFRGGKGSRRRRVWFEPGDMKYVILKLLKDKPRHGYEVMKELEEQTRGCYKPSPGTVYPTLQWLEDEGLVQCEEKDGKKIYSITEAGLTFLDENKSTVEEIFERVEETIDNLLSDPIPDVTRLVGRLVTQTYKAAWKLREDADKRGKVVDVLEKAMKELEELV